jgi:glycosyltransferase involved in cell wall biosynthesis
MQGLSIIICCHNSASRLPVTLEHLKRQKPAFGSWEVILVDNASDDNTVEVARSVWQNAPAPLRVVEEPKLGLTHARERGLAESKYELLGFVDDDNWVNPDWVSTAYNAMSSDLHLGAVGSICEPKYETAPPKWLQRFYKSLAILTDIDVEELPGSPNVLNGAGLCVRRIAWEKLIEEGFHFELTDRIGKRLSAGGDAELTMALRLAGWKLRVDQRLRLQHFMPIQRLQWKYLRKLHRQYCASQVLLDAYTEHSLSLHPGLRRWLSDRWWYQFGKAFKALASRPIAVIAAIVLSGEGRQEVIEVEKQFGRACGLVLSSARYSTLRHDLRLARWISRDFPRASIN